MTNKIAAGLFVIFLGYYGYTVFLADNALVKRTEITKEANGSYTAIIERLDGSKIEEIYVVDENGNPFSHDLDFIPSDPNAERRVIKTGTFIPKHQN